MKYPVRVLIPLILNSIAKPMAHGLWPKKPRKAPHTFQDSWGTCNSSAQNDTVCMWSIAARADENAGEFNQWTISWYALPNKYKSELAYVTNVYECYNVMGGGIILKDWVRVAWKPRILLGEIGSMRSRFHSSNEASPGAAAGLRLPGLRCQLCRSLALWPCANHLTSPTLSSLIC